MEFFRRRRCDIVVLEAGMGGAMDSTNVIDCPECAVICNIGLDHTAYLGDTVEKIAATPGLDAIFIGTGDLSLEMGVKFKADASANHTVDTPEMVAAIDRILAACKANNVIPGIVTASAEDAARRIRQGFQLVTCMNDLGFFRSRTNQHIQTVRQLVTGE